MQDGLTETKYIGTIQNLTSLYNYNPDKLFKNSIRLGCELLENPNFTSV